MYSSVYIFVTLPPSMKITVSTTWGITPSSTLPMSLWIASMGLVAWTTPTMPTPARRMSEKTLKSSVVLISSKIVKSGLRRRRMSPVLSILPPRAVNWVTRSES